MSVRVLVPSGVLGLGFDREALKCGVSMRPDIICIDGGSTDSGPFSLGTSTSKYSRAVCKAEWRDLMLARAELDVPLVISSCGTCGTDDMVRWMLEITAEIADELNLTCKVATLYSEQTADFVAERFYSGQVRALEPVLSMDEKTAASCEHIVALAGREQINLALDSGADIVLTGRATDTAAICALPIARGMHEGAAWHGAKIAECGAFCSTQPSTGVILLEVDENGFSVQPLASDARCTPHSVSAHMLYENSDPFFLYEPGGCLDVTKAHYEQEEQDKVRVTGSSWIPDDNYTVKLEGARAAGYQSTLLAIVRDPHYVKNIRLWIARLSEFLAGEIHTSLGVETSDYDLEFRLIGIDAALGKLDTDEVMPVEVGVLALVTATTEALTDEIAKLINPFVLHYPLTPDEDLPTFAFPFSPAQSDRGVVYEFCLNHVMTLDDPMQAFRLETVTLGGSVF